MLRHSAAFAFGCALVALVEGGLALLGVKPLSREDRFTGFQGSAPLFVREAQDGVYRLNPSKARFFNQQSFRMPKPAGTVRIVSFGGSATFGHPFQNETSFPAWTARLLGRYDPKHTYENINAGGISYASYRVRRLMEELPGWGLR